MTISLIVIGAVVLTLLQLCALVLVWRTLVRILLQEKVVFLNGLVGKPLATETVVFNALHKDDIN